MDFDEVELDGDETYLVYSDDFYDDLDISPPPSPPPLPKRKPVKIDFEMDEEDYKRMHDQVRKIQSSFLDDTEALQKASKKSDAAALRYVTGLMEKVSVAPVSQSHVPSARKQPSHQIVEVSMPGSEPLETSQFWSPPVFEERESQAAPSESTNWRHRGRLSTETVARLNSISKISPARGHGAKQVSEETQALLRQSPAPAPLPGKLSAETAALLQSISKISPAKGHGAKQVSEETQALLKQSPAPAPLPGKLSAETVALLQANNPRSPFARSQSFKLMRSETKPSAPPAPAQKSERRKQIEQKLEGILDYEIPATDRFNQMRRTLLDVNDKMVEHRILLDKYSGLDMSEPSNVNEEVEHKYHELIERMPQRNVKPKTSEEKLRSSSMGVTGYGKGLVPNDTQPVTELRGRIRRLLCRSKNNPHYYRF